MTLFIIIIITAFFLFLLFYPFKVRIYLSLTTISIHFLAIPVFRKKYDDYYQMAVRTLKKKPYVIKLQSEYLRVIKHLKFKTNRLYLGGYEGDYAKGAIAYGIGCGLASSVKAVLDEKGIPFEYKMHMIGPLEAEFISIFNFRLGRIIYEVIMARRIIRGKRASN